MEARITKLEFDMAHASRDIGDVKSKLTSIDDRLRGVEMSMTRLDERVAHLPSKEYLVRTVLGALAVIAALVLFADRIKQVFGL